MSYSLNSKSILSMSAWLIPCLIMGCQPELREESDTHIVNGTVPPLEQNDERLLSTVAVTTYSKATQGKAFCSGTLINTRVVLTAGHCIENGEYYVSFGRRVTTDSVVRVSQKIRHPDFSAADTLLNDIALLILETDAPYPAKAASIFTGRLPIGSPAQIAGFGVTQFYGPDDTGILRQASVHVASVSQAPTPEIVFRGMNGEDSCQGDSGGPAYVYAGERFRLVGLTSWGEGCGIEGHYTDVRSFIPWIRETLRSIR